MMKKIKLHLASEPAIYAQVFLFSIIIFALQYTGANLSGSISAHADALHLITDQVVYLVMILVGVLVFNFKHKERALRVGGGLIGTFLFLLVGYDILRDSYEILLSGKQHTVVAVYMLLFTSMAAGLNWLQHTLLVTAESRDTLTSFDLQGHVKIDMYKNTGLVVIALLNIFFQIVYLDIMLGVFIGLWLIYRGLQVLFRTIKLYNKRTHNAISA